MTPTQKQILTQISELNTAERKQFDAFMKFRFKNKKFSTFTENELNEIKKQIEIIKEK